MSTAPAAKRGCPGCGAYNRADAEHCWQCFASFGRRSVNGPLLRGINGPVSAVQPGPGSTPARWAHGLQFGASDWTRTLFAVALVAIVGVALLSFMDDPYPTSVGGYERLDESAQTDTEMSRRVEEAIAFDDADVEVTLYGTEDRLHYGIYELDLPDGLSFDQYADPTGSAKGSLLLSNLVSRDFYCERNSDPPMCGWREGEDVTVLGGFNISIAGLKPMAREVRGQMLA